MYIRWNSGQTIQNETYKGGFYPMLLDKIALLLTIIGALNWGLVGIFKFDLVAFIGGNLTLLSRAIYTLISLAGAWCITLLFRDTTTGMDDED